MAGEIDKNAEYYCINDGNRVYLKKGDRNFCKQCGKDGVMENIEPFLALARPKTPNTVEEFLEMTAK